MAGSWLGRLTSTGGVSKFRHRCVHESTAAKLVAGWTGAVRPAREINVVQRPGAVGTNGAARSTSTRRCGWWRQSGDVSSELAAQVATYVATHAEFAFVSMFESHSSFRILGGKSTVVMY